MDMSHGPIHPGNTLFSLMLSYGVSAYRVAKAIGMQPIAITRLKNGQQDITPQTALLFEKYFASKSAEEWLQLQAEYDLAILRARPETQERLAKIERAKRRPGEMLAELSPRIKLRTYRPPKKTAKQN
jgi:addiction module HigA family antidote